MEKVVITVEGGVATISLNRPEVRNAIDLDLAGELMALLAQIRNREEVRACVLTGNGPSFCAGADLKARQRMSQAEQQRHSEAILQCTNMLEALPMPVIAAINGPAIAGGLEVAIACDIRIASSQAAFALTEIALGVFPGAGAPLRLPRLVGTGWAKYLVLTGARITAAEALRLGLVQVVVEPQDVLPEATALAARISGFNPASVRAAKRLLNAVPEMSYAAAMELSAALRHPLNQNQDWLENIKRF